MRKQTCLIIILLIACIILGSCNAAHANLDDQDVTIKILTTGNDAGIKTVLNLMADVFNSEHEHVKAEIVMIPEFRNIDDTYDTINTKISVKGEIDLLWLWDSTDLWRYQERDLLEDLTPYIEKSVDYSLDRMVPGVVKCFQKDGGFYGLSPWFSIDSLGGKASQIGEKAGWTTEELLRWFQNHPDCKGEMGLYPDFVLNYFFLPGNLERYVDFEQRKAYFDGEDFRSLLQSIKALPLDKTMYAETWYDDQARDYVRLELIRVNNLESYCNLLKVYGEEACIKGFPTIDGLPRHYMSAPCLAMLKNGDHKEEAYQFMEFVQLRFPEYFQGNSLWTDRELLEQSLSNVTSKDPKEEADKGIRRLSDKEAEALRTVINTLEVQSLESKKIIQIVIEEIWPYFSGGKSLDDVCAIIQGRAQLLLDE